MKVKIVNDEQLLFQELKLAIEEISKIEKTLKKTLLILERNKSKLKSLK